MTSQLTQIPAPRVSLLNERTGLISRQWYRYFLAVDDVTSTSGDFLNHVEETRNDFSPDNDTWHIIAKDSPTIALDSGLNRNRPLTITNVGTGVVLIVPISGETINGNSSLSILYQWSTAQLLPYTQGYVII